MLSCQADSTKLENSDRGAPPTLAPVSCVSPLGTQPPFNGSAVAASKSTDAFQGEPRRIKLPTLSFYRDRHQTARNGALHHSMTNTDAKWL